MEILFVLVLGLSLVAVLCSGQINDLEKIDCEPEGVADEAKCVSRGCIYEEVNNEPTCIFYLLRYSW